MSGSTAEWIFTFGFGQTLPDGTPLAGKFVRINAETAGDARARMVERFGRNWSMQYPSEDEAGVRKHGRTELVEVGL
jgi:hypothetical protein